MKTVNKVSVFLLFFGLLIAATLQSCQKYSDGPTLSLISRKERVANTWKVDNYTINATDYTSLVTNYTETYSKKGDYSYSWALLNGTGTWAFQNNDAEIKITGTTNQTSHTLFILKLEENAFWYYYMDGTDKHILHLVSN